MTRWSTSAAPVRHTIDRLVEWGAGALYLLTVLLVLGVSGRLAAHLIPALARARSSVALMGLLDPILLLMMLAELLHTVALTLKTHHLPLRPLMALVFMAVLRHTVVLTSTGSLASVDAAMSLGGLVALSLLLWRLPNHDAD